MLTSSFAITPRAPVPCGVARVYPDSTAIDDRVKTTFVNRYYGHATAPL
jgi:hypothetical protein